MDLIDIARAHGGLVTRRAVIEAGGSPRRLEQLARKGALARIARGVYAVCGTATQVVEPWVVTRALNVVLSFQSAAAWWGVDMPAALRRTHVTAPRNRGRRADSVRGVRLHRATLRTNDVARHCGVLVTSPLRTALDIARHASLEHAVVIVDGFMRKELFSYDEFIGAARRAGGPGRLRIERVALLCDPASGSVLESLTRVLLWRNGLRPSATQQRVRHSDGWRGYLDFAWPELRVALECDGYEWHATRDPFQRDRRRWSTLARLGWRLGVVTWFDVTTDPAYVVNLVADLLGRPRPECILHTNVTGESFAA